MSERPSSGAMEFHLKSLKPLTPLRNREDLMRTEDNDRLNMSEIQELQTKEEAIDALSQILRSRAGKGYKRNI